MQTTPIRSRLAYDAIEFSRILSCGIDQTKAVLAEIISKRVCDAEGDFTKDENGDVTLGNGVVTLISRRITRDLEKIEKRRLKVKNRVKKHRDKKRSSTCNASVTKSFQNVTPLHGPSPPPPPFSPPYTPSLSSTTTPSPIRETARGVRRDRQLDAINGIAQPKGELMTEAFHQAWDEWITYHEQRGEELTPLTTHKALEVCRKMGHDAAIAAINFSISNGYKGLVPEKQNGDTNGSKNQRSGRGRREGEFADDF